MRPVKGTSLANADQYLTNQPKKETAIMQENHEEKNIDYEV